MAANLLPIIAIAGAAFLLLSKKGNGNGSAEGACPEGEVQTGTKRDGSIICGPPVTPSPPTPPTSSGRPTGLATGDLDVPLPGPADPYAGQPWTSWPQPILSDLAGYTCPIGHILVYRGELDDGTIGFCGVWGDEDFVGESWCIPPWGAVRECSGALCDAGLTPVEVVDGGQLRNVCRNIPTA